MRNGGACRVHVIDEKVSNVEKGVCRHIIDIDVPMKPVCTAELGWSMLVCFPFEFLPRNSEVSFRISFGGSWLHYHKYTRKLVYHRTMRNKTTEIPNSWIHGSGKINSN